ncbi:methylmalonate-semialdehyde dehydrogenase (acylating) [Iodidimonas muriae]|uniref:methylmalonate-semialdehyde dehydrogenase (CoA acylating) n=1 Tax=Iodidimonas muriae TaxID=261467 RepID=A0ABQ2L6J3_9PROT|nr:CoA-acylating methylmalonate-semialdehyde dehydrogenase [Iodidimonas muriae]GER06544.1 methylmalonate-semialdehyde dehydrogenase (acylating) [Kordiimonadales bacterium JCM 17843]GGO05215.1 methylmalonate-semialdehyde dehydrogenase (acylating) [Iodidimonas muriae]
MTPIPHLIGGKPYVLENAQTVPVFNPATGEETARLAMGCSHEVDAAVKAAQEALNDWSQMPPARRAHVLFALRDVMHKRRDDIARTISAEHGKTHDDALGEVARALEVVEFACGIPHLLKGDFSRHVARDLDACSERQPLGVVAGITPFNFPSMVPLWMIPMALACGNCFILKPSERDPSSANLIHELFEAAGLPKGVLNVVHGGKAAVDAILDHPGISAVSFVGSTPIAEYVYARGCAAGKRVQALGGAKNHMVILPDADLDQAADALMGAGFGSAGERCMAISVAVPVGEETANRLVEKLTPRVQSLKIGPSTDKDAEMGPLITKAHRDKVADLISKGEAEGARVVVDGRGYSLQGYEGGFWMGGTLLDGVTKDMTVYREEIFGPVLSVLRAGSYDEAVGLINDHQYGNGTAIFTRDGDAARDFTRRIEVGMVGVNVPIPVPVGYHSFGGWKRSIFGAHGIYGPEAVHFYTRLKTVSARWPTGIRAGAEFTFPSNG